MSVRGGGVRDRIRGREFSSRFEEKPLNSQRGNVQPPSRHLWIGNLHHGIYEGELADQFLQFGELESVAFQPGRSYAFVNFRNDDDAIAAMRALKGFPLAGNPLRIEFAKADKPSASSHDEDYLQRRGDQHSAVRGSPFSQRDSRARHASPDPFHPEESKTSGKDGEPSEVLWIGFPALLKVDEATLRKAFSPFGVIEKISIFPGRSYAFVRFRNMMSACSAKENLQGKLLGNPRVHICFARSETGSSTNVKNSMNTPSSPHYNPNDRLGPADGFREDMNLAGDRQMRSRFNSDLDQEDSDSYRFNRRGSLQRDGDNELEPWRYTEMGSEAEDFYDHRYRSPKREREPPSRDFPFKFSQKGSVYEEEQWDFPEDPYFLDRSKRLKANSFPPERELPEYPFSDREKEERHAYHRRFSDSPQLKVFDRNFEAGPHGYKQTPDRPRNLTVALGERSDQWRGSSYDGFQVGSGSLPPKPVESKRFTPESNRSSLRDWKWEGTIAKGGTPVCHARCLPVGKVMDIMLPEFLDCTTRTGLDMLAKHYYQADASWVVFFTPCSDADIGLYNEFMHYLEEKQRAAVAKLDDSTTLFLVPPSDFSEKVLRVPGRLSISGVVLRLEHPGSDVGYLPEPNEAKDRNLLAYHPDTSYPKQSSGSFSSDAHSVRNLPDSYNNGRHEYHPQSLSATRNMQSQNSNSTVGHSVHEQQRDSSDQYPGGMSIANLQPEQLAQLVSLLGQQRQSTGTDSKQGNATNQSDNASGTTAHRYPSHDNQTSSEFSNYQFGEQQPGIQRELQSGSQVSQQMQSSNSTRDEGADTDPQKRLQATLQLAAALLQQIQQGKGT